MENALTFRQRIIRAGSWSLAAHVLTQGIRLGGNLVLTRLLVPEMFGLMAVVYVLMIGLALFSDFGVGQSIVQSARGSEAEFLDTAWVIQILRGIFLFALSLLMSGGLAFAAAAGWTAPGSVYADPMLPPVVAAFSATILIQGFESTRLWLARRNLALDAVARIDIAGQVAALLVMLFLAVLFRSVWALVAGGITSVAVRVALSHIVLAGPANRWRWERRAAGELLRFGKWVLLSSAIGFLVANGDRLLLAGLIDAETLGLYAIAFLLVNSLQVAVGQIMASVALPALSQVARERPAELANTYYKFRLPLDAVHLALSGLLFSFGPTLVGILYDPRYADAGAMLSILALGGIAARYQVVDQCYLALGKPALLTVTGGLRLAALYTLLPLLFFHFGLEGALWAIVIHPYAALPAVFYFKHRYGLLQWRREAGLLAFFPLGLLAGRLAALGFAA